MILRIGAGALALAAVLGVAVAQARQTRHHHHAAVGCGHLALIVAPAPSHAFACVAPAVQGTFQAFVSALAATGYHIDFMGGWRPHGSCRGCDMHPRALAIDINQTGRNRVTRRFPAGVTALAARFGLLHGAVWRNADAGHFEVAGVHHYAAHPGRHRAAAGQHAPRQAARVAAPSLDPHQEVM